MLLEDRRIIVTGSSRGLGRAIAVACAREGAVVGLNYLRSEKAARALAEEIGALHGREAVLLPADAADPAAVEAAVARFAEAVSGVDALVNNAGQTAPGLLAALAWEDVERTVRVNLLGPLAWTRAVLPHLLARRRGVVLNVSSVAAVRPSRGQAAYAATKGALEALTRALAVEYGRKGIRACCLRPGPVDTEMLASALDLAGDEVRSRVPLGRLGTPEEVAALGVALLSDRASFVTGAVLPVDGGFGVA